MKLSLVSIAGVLVVACRGVSAPDASVVEAGAATVQNGCAFLEGIDDSGTLQTICATAEEIATLVVPFVLLARRPDAGAPAAFAETCKPLPGSTLCASSREIAKAIAYVVRVRAARTAFDGGT